MKITNFNLEKWYLKYEFSSKHNLSASGISALSLDDYDLDLNFNSDTLTYLSGKGSDELINTIAIQNDVNPENILVTNGAIEALFLTQVSLIEKDDNVIVVKPTYPALYQIAADLGANIIDWDLDFSESFKPNIDKLANLLKTYQPKLLIINFPNNPTGKTLSHFEIKEIVDLCSNYGTKILSDEVYKGFSLSKINSTYSFNNDICISVNSLSKISGLPGLRIGWLFADKKIIKKCLNLRHYTTLCNNYFGEKIAVKVLQKKVLEKTINKVKQNKRTLLKQLNIWKYKDQIGFVEPDVGCMVFVKLNEGNSEQFCIDFEKKSSVLLLPGNKYGEKYKSFFRLGFGIDQSELLYCLDQLNSFLENYKFV